jgi:hypothetical protein
MRIDAPRPAVQRAVLDVRAVFILTAGQAA